MFANENVATPMRQYRRMPQVLSSKGLNARPAAVPHRCAPHRAFLTGRPHPDYFFSFRCLFVACFDS
jgi:hypothetical protein